MSATHEYKIPGLHWTLKKSFVDYIMGMKDGQYAISSGAYASADFKFTFPLVDQSQFDTQAGVGVIRFAGDIRFGGHFGMLFVMIADPILEVTLNEVSLSVMVDEDGERIILSNFADFSANKIQTDEGLLVWPDVLPLLTADGASLFNDQYAVGSSFDPLTVVVPA